MTQKADVLGPLEFTVDTFDVPDGVQVELIESLIQIPGVSSVLIAPENYKVIVQLDENAPTGHIRQRVRDLVEQFSKS